METMSFNNLFKTHKVYITLDDNKIYKVSKDDFSLIEVDRMPSLLSYFIILHKQQFEFGKQVLMNPSYSFRLSLQDAEIYKKIRFITEKEFEDYKNAVVKFDSE